MDVAYGDGSNIALAMNNGSMGFTISVIAGSGNWQNILARDSDGTNGVDLFTLEYSYVARFANDGSANFTKTNLYNDNYKYYSKMDYGQFNGDGLEDYVTCESQSGGKVLLFTSIDGVSFNSSTVAWGSGCPSLAAGDYNLDGLDDVLFALNGYGGDRYLKLALNNGNGTFSEVSVTTVPDTYSGFGDLELFDVDLDGDLDIIYSYRESNTIVWRENLVIP